MSNSCILYHLIYPPSSSMIILSMDKNIPLNNQQKIAVFEDSCSTLVLAGAGTGKTRFLCAKIIHALKNGYAPDSIVAITFTNKAAKEMKERIKNYSKLNNRISFVGTFHSFGVFLLRSFGSVLKIPNNFAIADTEDSTSIIKKFLKEQSLDPKHAKAARNLISKYKRLRYSYEYFPDKVYQPFGTKVFLKIWEHYENELKKASMLDFDDLIKKSVELLENFPDVRKTLNEKYRYIFIDEFQDIDALQNNLIQLIKGDGSKVCAVGDMDQNIYSWRGSDPSFALDFAELYKPSKIFTLEENYRSTKNIIDAANTVIKNNKARIPRELITSNSSGDLISIYLHQDSKQEAQIIADKIKSLALKGVKYQNIAILYRNNFQSRELEKAFLQENIPYNVVGQKYFARAEIKDICAYLRYICVGENNIDLTRIINQPPRGIGAKSQELISSGEISKLTTKAGNAYKEFVEIMNELKQYAKENSLKDLAQQLVEKIKFYEYLSDAKDDFEDRILNVKELVHFLSSFEGKAVDSANDFFENIALQSDQDEVDEKKGKVTLMTVHASKGLEFEYVFVTGLEEGLFPSIKDDENIEEQEESERRLFYVALTRAKLNLYLHCAYDRLVFSNEYIGTPSRFLNEIPTNCIELAEEDNYLI